MKDEINDELGEICVGQGSLFMSKLCLANRSFGSAKDYEFSERCNYGSRFWDDLVFIDQMLPTQSFGSCIEYNFVRNITMTHMFWMIFAVAKIE